MFFAFLRSALLQKLLMDVFPVSKSTFHNAGNQRQFFCCRPVFDKQRKVEVVVDKEIVLLLVVGFLVVFDTLAEALQTECRIFVRWAIKASDLDAFLNAAFAN